jgi:hypothetical protein
LRLRGRIKKHEHPGLNLRQREVAIERELASPLLSNYLVDRTSKRGAASGRFKHQSITREDRLNTRDDNVTATNPLDKADFQSVVATD